MICECKKRTEEPKEKRPKLAKTRGKLHDVVVEVSDSSHGEDVIHATPPLEDGEEKDMEKSEDGNFLEMGRK